MSDKLRCDCVMENRKPNESQREWFKRWMCMFHWTQTDYYQRKLDPEVRTWDVDTDTTMGRT
jgi:hypothetical protein